MLLNAHPSENLGLLSASTFRLEVSAKKHTYRGHPMCKGLAWGVGRQSLMRKTYSCVTRWLSGFQCCLRGKVCNQKDLVFLSHMIFELLHLHGQPPSPRSILSFLDHSNHLLTRLSTSSLASFPSSPNTASHKQLLKRQIIQWQSFALSP